MSAFTYFVVLPFQVSKSGQLVALEAQEAPSAVAARQRAQRYADAGGGGIAFSRTGDPATGDYDDVVILGVFGNIAEEAMAA